MQKTLYLVRKTLVVITFFAGIYAASCNAQQMSELSQNQLVLPAEDQEIRFNWQGDTVNATWEPYAFLLIPVTLPNCPKQFFMQFDTGSPNSLFYKSKLKAIQLKYPRAILMADTATVLQSYSFKADGMTIFAKEIGIRQKTNAGINWTDKKSIEIIGTIGADFIENKVVIIDYPRHKMFIGSDIPSKLKAQTKLTDFMFMRRSVLLPAIIKGKKSMLFFDSGSSAYELLTDKKTCQSFSTTDSVPVTYMVKSWDRMLTANTFSITDSIEVASTKIPITHATFMEGVGTSQVEQMMKLGIGGMTGNKLFINHLLILDTKNKKFGVISASRR